MKDGIIKNVAVKYKPGDLIFKEGSEGNRMYIIKKGSVKLTKLVDGDEILLAKVQEKEFFGEMALFGMVNRTASAYAIGDTELIPITKNMLEVALGKVPDWLVILVRQLVKRLKDTDERVHVGIPKSGSKKDIIL